MKEDFIKDYKLFLDRWGIEAQIDMAIEEMSELIKEFCKRRRLLNKNASKEQINENVMHIKEEISDVLNMVEQMEYFFGCEDIETIRKSKIERTKQRINSNI